MSGTSINPKRQMIAVDGCVGQRQAGGVLDRELDAFEPERGGAAAGDLDHLGSDVGREQLAARLDQRQHHEADLAGPGREVEDPLPRSGSSSSIIRSESTAVARANSSRWRSQPAATLRQASTCSAAVSPMPPRP